MNKKVFLPALFLSALLIFICPLYPAESLVFDSDFFQSLGRMSSIERDIYLEGLTGSIIIGRGTILTVVERENYKRNYRIEVSAGESSRFRLKFLYYVYFDDKNIIDLLTEDSNFEFKGQLMGITPVNSQRSEFILDIVYMEGSTIIQ
jgi:hypothetical protein